MNEFGALLRKARKEKDLTQEDLGEIIGMKNTQISEYERGEVTPLSTNLKRITNALALPPDYFDDVLPEGFESESSEELLLDELNIFLKSNPPKRRLKALLETVRAYSGKFKTAEMGNSEASKAHANQN